MIKENKDILKMIKDKGDQINKIISIEELSELQKEICKDLRGYERRNEIKEEMCDVYICLQMLKNIYKFNDEELEEEYNKKMKRNIDRIKEKELKKEEVLNFSSPEECLKHFIKKDYKKGYILFKQAAERFLEKYNLIPKEENKFDFINNLFKKLVTENILEEKFKFNSLNYFYDDVEDLIFDSKKEALEHFEWYIESTESYNKEPMLDILYVVK